MNATDCSLLLLPVCLLLGPSTSPRRQDPATTRPEKFVLEPGDHTVQELVDRSATFLGRNYLIHSPHARIRPDAQMVHLQTKLELGLEACEETVNQLLLTHDWVLTPLDTTRGTYEWIHCMQQNPDKILQRSLTMTPDEVLARPNLCMHVTTQVALRYLDPSRVGNALTSLLRDQRNLTRYGALGYSRPVAAGRSVIAGGTVVFSGLSQTVAKAVRIVREADRRQKESYDWLAQRLTKLEQRLEEFERPKK